jgi:hypothetical protein
LKWRQRLREVPAVVVVDIAEAGVDPRQLRVRSEESRLEGVIVPFAGGGKVALGAQELASPVPELTAPDVRVDLLGKSIGREGLGEAERLLRVVEGIPFLQLTFNPPVVPGELIVNFRGQRVSLKRADQHRPDVGDLAAIHQVPGRVGVDPRVHLGFGIVAED